MCDGKATVLLAWSRPQKALCSTLVWLPIQPCHHHVLYHLQSHHTISLASITIISNRVHDCREQVLCIIEGVYWLLQSSSFNLRLFVFTTLIKLWRQGVYVLTRFGDSRFGHRAICFLGTCGERAVQTVMHHLNAVSLHPTMQAEYCTCTMHSPVRLVA